MNTETNQAVIYVRRIFSDLRCPEDKDPTTVEQIDEIGAYLEGKPDVTYGTTISDGHKQKQATALPGFERLIPLFESHQYDCLVLYTIEQFANSMQENRHCLLTLLPQLGVRIITFKEDYDSVSSGDATEGYPVLSRLLDAAEVNEHARREKMDFLNKRSKGKTSYTYCPYGYLPGAPDTADIHQDADSSVVVQKIFRDYLSGMTINDIARELTQKKVPSPSKHKKNRGYQYHNASCYWLPTTVQSILSNPVYTGDLVFSNYRNTTYLDVQDKQLLQNAPKQMIENHHAALVSREDFQRVQLILEVDAPKKRPRKPNPDRLPPNPYQNLIRCARCGALMHYTQRNLAGNNPYAVFICSNAEHRGSNSCSLHLVRFDSVDREIWTALEAEIRKADQIATVLESSDNLPFKETADEYQRQMDQVVDEIRTVTLKTAQLHAQFMTATLPADEYYSRKEELEEQTRKKSAELQTAMTRLRDYRAAYSAENPWLKMFHKRTLPETMTFSLAKELIEQVTISPDTEDITITLKNKTWKDLLIDGIEGIQEGA